MSKKKNTLKDLDDFLKQQAASLVPPEKLSERLEVSSPKATGTAVAASQTIPEDLKDVFKTQGLDALCDAILTSLPAGTSPTEDEIMLINTALYIKGGRNWKEAVRAYWAKA